MLKKVDPTNTVLITYLQTTDTSIETGVLLAIEEAKKTKSSKKVAAESSKKSVKESKFTKSPKKLPITEAEPIKPEVVIADTPSTQKEIIPLKTGVFRRIKMKSKHKSRSPVTNVVRKPLVSHQGVIFREIPVPDSPCSKKRRATDMAKHISKKKKKSRVIISSNSTADENETIPETPEADLQNDSSHLESTDVMPPEASVAKTVSVEARTSDIFVNISHIDENVTLGEDALHTGDKGKPSDVTPYIIVSLPAQLTPIIPTTSTTDSPTFENIIKQPITSLFCSQCTNPPTKTSPIQDSSFMETEHESEGFGGTFENLEFDEEETDFPDHMLMTMKQLKILNTKLNSILQSQADLGRGNLVTSLEVDGLLKMVEGRISSKVSGMIKDSESCLPEKIDLCDHSNEIGVNAQKSTFEGDLKELKCAARECAACIVYT
ncbi:unnamed protein product [Lactuca saligna]|uniref:Uncharacterized protein n=1 Tax=Lactuca saligna TaxID=75948 RepID=A0AA35ZEF4_LACSI|nr:unnamed protein product [Lactuca saligna]